LGSALKKLVGKPKRNPKGRRRTEPGHTRVQGSDVRSKKTVKRSLKTELTGLREKVTTAYVVMRYHRNPSTYVLEWKVYSME